MSSQPDTKDRILDVAEELFAGKGYPATSLRAITSRAKVNLAAVNYHFGSKESLVAEVINRRIIPLNEERLQKLEKVLSEASASGKKPEVKDLLLAFVEPSLHFPESQPCIRNFLTLIGRALSDPDETVKKIFVGHMQPVFHGFLDGLGKAMPEVPKEILYWRLNFVIGSLSHTMRCIDKCPVPIPHGVAHDSRSLVKLLMPFVTAGMEAPL